MNTGQRTKIAYFGLPSSFTHQAAIQHFGGSGTFCSKETIPDVFAAVTDQIADVGVVPIENSNEGAVTHTLDMFIDSPALICAEVYLDIHQNLLSACPLEEIKKVYSFPVAFGQCRKWLNTHLKHVELINVSSTARAAEIAASEPGAAAVASELAAEMYGLNITGHRIEDYAQNLTRFLVISCTTAPRVEKSKTSILFSVKDRAGALYDALSPFKDTNINLTKIESRPSKKKAWEYYFYVDIEGHVMDEKIAKSLQEIELHCEFVKILGSYALMTP
jgi:chorismate mutase/prephenate dehydratase